MSKYCFLYSSLCRTRPSIKNESPASSPLRTMTSRAPFRGGQPHRSATIGPSPLSSSPLSLETTERPVGQPLPPLTFGRNDNAIRSTSSSPAPSMNNYGNAPTARPNQSSRPLSPNAASSTTSGPGSNPARAFPGNDREPRKSGLRHFASSVALRAPVVPSQSVSKRPSTAGVSEQQPTMSTMGMRRNSGPSADVNEGRGRP